MRLLIVGPAVLGSLENSYVRAFREISGIEVSHFDVDHYRLLSYRHNLPSRLASRILSGAVAYPIKRALVQAVKRGAYDVVIIFKGMEFPRALLEECRRNSRDTFWANLNPDNPLNISSRGSTNQHVVDSLSFYDLYLIWSRHLVPKLKEAGCRQVEYLPFAYDPDMHSCAHPGAVNPDRVSFVGSWDKDRENILTTLRDFDLQIYGESWRRASASSGLRSKIIPHNLYGSELAEVVAGAAVSLNILRPQNAGSHNMRTFEIPAMGGLMLTTRSEEQQKWFPDDEACLMYGTHEELRNKVRFVLDNPKIAQNIRREGIARVEGHTYRARAEVILNMMG
jgi:spore maturation protein CgeB